MQLFDRGLYEWAKEMFGLWTNLPSTKLSIELIIPLGVEASVNNWCRGRFEIAAAPIGKRNYMYLSEIILLL